MIGKKPKIIAVVGPTASGKTAIAVKLAKRFNGEIVSADSRQIFRGLDIGTGKDLAEYTGVKYHMIDIADPGQNFNLFRFVEMAGRAIGDILERGRLPIIVGGTGLYVQALIEGFQLKQDDRLGTNGQVNSGKEQLSNLTIEQLQGLLNEIDSESLAKLADPKNPHRLIRAIERAREGYVMTKVRPNWDVLQVGLEWTREELNERIDRRVDDRFRQGMLDEVVNLLQSGVSAEWLDKLGLEYKIITEFIISQKISKTQTQKFQKGEQFEQMKDLLKLRSHQYAKRQMTWFKRFPEVIWEHKYSNMEKRVEGFLVG